jgi:hypothetical protein
MTTHQDFLGVTIQEGDSVVLIEPGYRNFVKGSVTRFTPKFVIVKFKNHNNYEKEIKQTGDQLVVVSYGHPADGKAI